MVHLQWLYLNDNQLMGGIPSSIESLVQLTELGLNDNQLMGSIPSSIGTLVHMLWVDFSWSAMPLTVTCRDRLSQLIALDLSANQFTASASLRLPRSLLTRCVVQSPARDGRAGVVLYGDLSNNRFSGSLPPSVWNTSVQQLFLNGNRFTGSFPSRGDRDCSLQYLSVSDNLLTGALPLDLALCVELTSFFASSMKLTGPVTGRFASQAQLQTVVIANNSLTGLLEFGGSQSLEGWILNAGYSEGSAACSVLLCAVVLGQ
eukprot:gene10287-biopygen4599